MPDWTRRRTRVGAAAGRQDCRQQSGRPKIGRALQAALAAVDWRALRIVAFTAGAPLLAWRAHQVYRRLPQLAATHSAKCLPSLAIIIPARNEEENLSRLLPSLSAIDYPGDVEVIVVDDGSMDATAAVAARHGMRVIRVDEVPAGWLGKPHACQQGAQAARGDWLLFTDADTVHQPEAAAAAVAYAASHDLDGLSLWLRNEFRGTADGLALMVALAGLFAIPQARALLNGQFILLRRDVYWAIGGHTPVAHEAMEDLALGRRLQALGYVVPLQRGERVAAARMYQSRMEWWSGLSRWGGRSLRWAGTVGVAVSHGDFAVIRDLVYPLYPRATRKGQDRTDELRKICRELRFTRLHYIAPWDNVPSILDRGILCRNRAPTDRVSFASEAIQEKRHVLRPDDFAVGNLHDYVPLFFAARPPLLSALRFQQSTLVYFRVSPIVLLEPGAVFSAVNAVSAAQFFTDIADLSKLDWDTLHADYWGDKSDPVAHQRKKLHRQAEALIPLHVPIDKIVDIVVHNENVRKIVLYEVNRQGLAIPVRTNTKLYYRA